MNGGVLICILSVILIYLAVQISIDSNRFKVVTYHIRTGKLSEPVRFVFLSDLHGKEYDPGNEKLLAKIDELKPRAILIGGDMITAHPGWDVGNVLTFMEKLAAKYKIYYGSGNHEQRLFIYPEKYGDTSERYEAALLEMGVIRLKNETVSLEDVPVDITGLTVKRRFYKRGRHVEMSADDVVQRVGKPEDNGRLKILLAHNPDFFGAYRQWGADIVLSGHVHGGIIRLPLLGGVISPKVSLFPKYDGGRFDEDGRVMIVSRGLGSHTIPLRLWNPGELVEIVLE